MTEKFSWSSREIRRPGRPLVEWLQLGSLGNPEVTVGVLKNGSWVVDTDDGLADLNDIKSLVGAFPMLNYSIYEVQEWLARFKQSTTYVSWQEFPFNQLVIHAISRGGYWAEKAFAWLSSVDLNDCERKAVIDGLAAIEANKQFNQQLRHKAMRCRRQLE